ncbi:hypothetical protein [Staphylococcus phage vB_SauH_DELF3]|nr:hypothetical protein [Staphylococcus phage vB_SauH_DELF3]
MNKDEAFKLLTRPEDVFNGNDIFLKVKNVHDPDHLFNREDDTEADSKFCKYLLEFLPTARLYILIAIGKLNQFKDGKTEQLTYLAGSDIKQDSLDTLDKLDTGHGNFV